VVKGFDNAAFAGWKSICEEVGSALEKIRKKRKVLVVECYQGVHHDEILEGLKKGLAPAHIFMARNAFLPESEIQKISFANVTDDRIFGFMTRLNMDDFMDQDKIESIQSQIESIPEGLVLVYGSGASLLWPEADILLYADMPRWEIQLRMRRLEVNSLGLNNKHEGIEKQYKRGYFVDWRICDRLKKQLFDKMDFVLDSTIQGEPRMVQGKVLLEGLKQTAHRPFSVVPYFDAGPWGGQWMKEVCDLDKSRSNFAWCFNCVPEENSLYLQFGDIRFETPSINLVFYQAVELLGDPVHARFGDEFPIRFDFLDTMGGGNLSLQVHPLTEYIQQTFGINYTQDESYYLMDADDKAVVYLGLKEGIKPEKMIADLRKSEKEGLRFQDEKHVKSWPAKKHDHFLIPGGTVHCSGKGSMVLEISSTPYIFTFKLWDWGRLGMDGKPRPINIGHGEKVIQWGRTENWTRENLVNRIEEINRGEGWREEKTGLHKREFIETRRHWFTQKVEHNTNDGVNVFCLVEGREVLVESPVEAFDPFVVHYAETFIVPAAVGGYSIRPYGESEGKECATVKAYIRVNP
jgi:mannose-6-phosphate isomerase class I